MEKYSRREIKNLIPSMFAYEQLQEEKIILIISQHRDIKDQILKLYPINTHPKQNHSSSISPALSIYYRNVRDINKYQ